MTGFQAMTLANIKMMVRNRSALFWLLAFPLLFILLFGYLLGDTGVDVKVGLVGTDTSQVAQQVADQMKQVDGFTVTVADRDSEMAALNKGDRQVVVVFGPGNGTNQATADIYFDQSNPQLSQIAVSAVQQYLNEANIALTNTPRAIAVQVQGVNTKDTRYIDFLVPGILAMSIMNNGLLGLSTAFVTYREKGILRRIKVTPFPLSSFIMAQITTQLLIALAQSVILVGAAWALFGLHVTGSYLSVLVLILLGSLAFLSIGFLISSVAKNVEVANSVANAISFPMLFLGGVFFPVDSAPGWLQPITKALPLTYLANGLRDVMVNGNGLFNVWLALLVMLATAAVGLVLSVRLFRWEARAV
jgi:ABC-2 type transport system permease protein